MACHISTFHWQAHSLSVFYWLNYLRIFRENIWENISTSKKVITYSQDSLQAWEKLTSYWWALQLTNNIKKETSHWISNGFISYLLHARNCAICDDFAQPGSGPNPNLFCSGWLFGWIADCWGGSAAVLFFLFTFRIQSY